MAVQEIDLGKVVGANGKNAYQYAVEGGYTGTEEEYKTLMANVASKQYVDSLIGNIGNLLDEINGEVV